MRGSAAVTIKALFRKLMHAASTPFLLSLFFSALSSTVLLGQSESPSKETGPPPSVTASETDGSEAKVAEKKNGTFSIPDEMGRFQSHVGRWNGMTKTQVTEGKEKSLSHSRSEWMGGYLLGGHVFEIRGHSHSDRGHTQFRWQYTYDKLKERYMAAYYDSNGRTHFFEGKINVENTKIVWRLLAPVGDMAWRVETDLKAEDGIETNGQITSKDYQYDMIYTSVFKRM